MEPTSVIILVGVAAFVGGMANALLGWAKQVPPEPWERTQICDLANHWRWFLGQ